MQEINDYDEAKEHWHGERVIVGDEDERREAQQQAMFDESRQRINVGSVARTGQDRRVTDLIVDIDRRIAIARRLADRLPK